MTRRIKSKPRRGNSEQQRTNSAGDSTSVWIRLRRRPNVRMATAGLLTVILLNFSFAPWDCWPLAFIALVPWTLAITCEPSNRRALIGGMLTGTAFWAISLYWLWWVTLVGYFGILFYLPLYWLAAALAVRSALRRSLPAAFVLPVIWVALEYARNYVISGFPWFFLGHSLYAQLPLIQIADITGQYGVSFVVATVNGAIVDVVLWYRAHARIAWHCSVCAGETPAVRQAHGPERSRRAPQLRRLLASLVATILVLGGVISYGYFRLAQHTTQTGPAIGIVQQAFPIHLGVRGASFTEVFNSHLQASRSFIGAGCDFVLWPESMLPPFMNHDALTMNWDKLSPAEVRDLAGRFGSREDAQEFLQLIRAQADRVAMLSEAIDCPLISGGPALHRNPSPIDENDHWVTCNSAMLFDRSWRNNAEYSKVHLVPFSEYVPFKRTHTSWYKALRWFVPDVMEQLEPGTRYDSFTVSGENGTWRVATPICYEGTFDRVCRNLVMKDGKKSVDVLANLSNDGWFIWKWFDQQGSTEHAQHLVQYCFRAVENRVPVVRAVNTGISASIDSNGRIIAEISQSGRREKVCGQLLLKDGARSGSGYLAAAQVLVDSRVSVYSLVGDVFAIAVAGLAGLLCAWLIWKRRSAVTMRQPVQAQPGKAVPPCAEGA